MSREEFEKFERAHTLAILDFYGALILASYLQLHPDERRRVAAALNKAFALPTISPDDVLNAHEALAKMTTLPKLGSK